ncbi:MAG: glycosyltransferase [Sphingobacteriaceae bacterium]|nr:glycosyltransferase [Sphingobacteriaceae bacterium]
MFELYRSTSINALLSVSYSEGLPVTMMEAISFGIPLIATNVGGCNEICNENTGVLIDRDFDPKKVAKILETFKNSEMNTSQFRAGCREYWKNNFEADKNYNSFINKLLN